MAGKRTLGDWLWTLVGIGGVACIGIAIWMFFGGRSGPTPEEAAKERAAQAAEHWKKGRERIEAGDGEAAVAEIQAALALAPEPRQPSIPELYDLGRALALAGKDEDASRAFVVVLNRRPTWSAPYLALARIFERKGQTGGAWRFYRAALALHPEPVPADLTARVEDLAKSVRAEREAEIDRVQREFRANPANVEAFSVLVIAGLEETSTPVDAGPAEGLRAAVAAAAAGIEGLPALLAAQESAVADRPGSVIDRSGLGNLLLLSGEAGRAEDVFAKATELSESDPSARLGSALAALLGEPAGMDAAEEAVRRLGGNPLAWLALGATRLARGEEEEAKPALANALRLNPVLPEVYRLFAKVLDEEKEAADREAALCARERLASR